MTVVDSGVVGGNTPTTVLIGGYVNGSTTTTTTDYSSSTYGPTYWTLKLIHAYRVYFRFLKTKEENSHWRFVCFHYFLKIIHKKY